MVRPDLEGLSRLVVDGNNVMGTRPDGWWRDRRAAAARLVDRLSHLAGAADIAVTVVFDGPAPHDDAAPLAAGVDVRYAARRGPDAADDVIAALADAAAEPLTVVTADRGLRARVEAAGGRVLGPSVLLEVLDALDGAP